MKSTRIIGWGLVVMAVCLFLAPVTSEAREWTVGRNKNKTNFRTIQQAMDNATVTTGDIITLAPGTHKGARITKNVTIQGSFARGKSASAIAPFAKKDNETVGLLVTSPATIKNLNFRNVSLPIYGTRANGVTVDNNTITNAVQGITNWNGQNWQITNNTIKNLKISRKGKMGGAGIVVGTTGPNAVDARTNTIRLNNITGNMQVSGFKIAPISVAGIALVDNSTAGVVTANTVDNNTVQLMLRKSKNNTSKLFGIMMNDQANAANNTIVGNTFTKNNLVGAGIQKRLATGIAKSDFFAAKPVSTVNNNTFGTAANVNKVDGVAENVPVVQGATLDLKPY